MNSRGKRTQRRADERREIKEKRGKLRPFLPPAEADQTKEDDEK